MFLLIWLQVLWSRKDHWVPALWLCNAIKFLFLYVCMLLHATLLSWWVGWSYFTKTTCACLLIWEPVGASVRLVHPRTWFKPPVAICFATDRSKAVTPRVLTFVNCLWRHFETDYNHAVFSSLLFGCVGRLCLLDVAIPDMHISLFCILGHMIRKTHTIWLCVSLFEILFRSFYYGLQFHGKGVWA